jgi:hypothetical protein
MINLEIYDVYLKKFKISLLNFIITKFYYQVETQHIYSTFLSNHYNEKLFKNQKKKSLKSL